LIILEEGASATLLEETSSATATASGLHVGAVELLLAPRSNLRYVQLQNWNDKVWHFAHQAGRIQASASLQWTVGALGGKLSHIHQDVYLDGKGAAAEVNGVTFATERQVISYYTQQTHNAPNTRSDLLYKDVVRDKARCIWRGMIKVAKDAQKTDGYQRNDSLLMSDECRADAIPGLEIEADDVRCTHGATCGRVDEEQLFYCMCRGLNRSEAMHMIVEGFFQRVYDRIPVEIVRETLGQAVEKKLGIGGV
jgi:Fe-S cluster assembly protein SufD